MKQIEEARQELFRETTKCRACRFCMDVCPTYQSSAGVEAFSSYGRLQIMRYLLLGVLEMDDSLVYCLYSCLQCKRCEVVCKSKGQDLEICNIIQLGRAVLSRDLLNRRHDEKN
ncbi:MAG TPA: (Fe-S)-binding protein [Desulfobacterales bacterium]|nr:(Fe-S)-binding protein [Desulfobacterales bacterium]